MVKNRMFRLLDVCFALLGLLLSTPILLIIYILGLYDTGSPLFIQQRVGRYKKSFKLVKFRTMSIDTKSMATHLSSASSITRFGHFLRKTKLDELPQLWNVLKGEMSLVGPRPNLYNQELLIEARERRGVYHVLPGITGLAQVVGVDMSEPEKLAVMDAAMIETISMRTYFKYIVLTIIGRGQGDRVKAL